MEDCRAVKIQWWSHPMIYLQLTEWTESSNTTFGIGTTTLWT